MISKQILSLQKILKRLEGGVPQVLIFFHGDFPDVTDSSTLQFEVHGSKIFYNLEIKKFSAALLKFFLGEYQLGTVPLSQGLSDAVIYFELEHLIFETIKKIPKKNITLYLDVNKTIIATRNKAITAIPAEVAETIQEKATLFYFNFSPKQISQYLKDFPSTNHYSYATTLLLLSVLGYLTLSLVEEKNSSVHSKEENLYSAIKKMHEAPAKKQVQIRLDNLRKILNKVKQL